MTAPITQPHSLERQELLAKASSHGAKFFATGGSHCTTDDFFKAIEIPVWDAQIKAYEDKKEECSRLEKAEEDGKAVLALGKAASEMNVEQLGLLLVWYTSESKTKLGKKPERVAKWKKIVEDKSPPPILVK